MGRGDRPLSILVVNPDVPPADRDSGSLRLFRLLALLVADGHRVTLVARRGTDQEPAALALERLGIEVHRADPERLPAAHRPYVDAPDLDLAAVLHRTRPDVAWLSFHEIAEAYLPLLRRHAPGARVVVDTVDVHCVREQRAAELSGRPEDHRRAAGTRAREAATYSAADALVAVSADDAAVLRELAPGVPVHIVSNVHAPEPAGPPREHRDGVLFVGNFRHAPNVDAAVAFVAESWPRIRQTLPRARLKLVGTAPPPEVQALAAHDIEVTGWVPETRPHLDAARVSIAPLRYGAGVKGKIGEALAHGLPVVTTTIGAEGMDLADGEHALVADEPIAFADAVVALHSDADLWDRLARAGRAHLDGTLGPGAARAALHGLLADVAPQVFVAGDDLDAALAGYLGAFGEGDRVSLVVGVRDGQNPDDVFAVLVQTLERLGRDPERIPDVALTAWPHGTPAPSTAISAPPADWHAAPDPAPRRRFAANAAVVVRLPEHADGAAAQIDALARAGLADDTEVILVAPDDAGPQMTAALDRATGATVLRMGAHLGRRAALQRAVASTGAPVIVALEPYTLPRPGFAVALTGALARTGAAFAGPAGLRVAPDGSLWPGGGDALPLHALAAARDTWLDAPAALPGREGHAEAQLAAWAQDRGGVAVAREARVDHASSPAASVVICTRNRADELEDCIALLVAHGAGDVVIVDNGSTDATPELAAELAARHPGIVRVAHEPRPGLCHARNAGAAAARHDLLLYLDDDARPAPGWLRAAARELGRPGVVNVGGPIAALWPAERAPGWPAPGLEALFSVLDRGDADRTLTVPDVVYGANWGVRRSALDAVGGFDPAFGPSPDARINGDEVSVAWRLHRAGLGLTRYVAAAAVGHRIPASRVSERFLVHRALACGIERPRHAAALDGVDAARFNQQAGVAATRVLGAVPMAGELRLEDAVAAIEHAPVELPVRTFAADALGELAACVLLLGATEAQLGPLKLRVAPQHLHAVLDAPLRAAA